jgi:predicted oxidoreductase
MDRIQLSKNIFISRIVYGMWRVGDVDDTSPKHVQAKIEACLEQGITTIDQADIYGGYTAEAILGNCFAQAPKLAEQVEIITKCDIVAPVGRYSDARVKYYDTSAAHIKNSIDISLKEMRIEKIDVLLIHRPDPFMDHHETGKALDDAIASGKIRAAGVSNFKPHDWNLLQSAMKNTLVTNQIEISVLARDTFTNGDLAFHQQNNVSPMAWSPLGGGSLFDKTEAKTKALRDVLTRISKEQNFSMDAIAIAWLLKHPANIVPVMGTNNLQRIAKFSDAMKVALDRQTWFEILTAAQGHEVA